MPRGARRRRGRVPGARRAEEGGPRGARDARAAPPRAREAPPRAARGSGHLRGARGRGPADRRRQRGPAAHPRVDDEALHDGGRPRPPRACLPVQDAPLPRRRDRRRRRSPGPPRRRRRRRPGLSGALVRRRPARGLPAVGRVARQEGPEGGQGRARPRRLVLRRHPGAPGLARRAGGALVPGARVGAFVQRQRRSRARLGRRASRRARDPRLRPARPPAPEPHLAGRDGAAPHVRRRPPRGGQPHGGSGRGSREEPDVDRAT